MKTKFLIVLVALIALAACAPAPTPAPTAAPPTAAPVAPAATTAPVATTVPPTATAVPVPVVKLKVAYSTLNPDPLPLWVAKDAGFFEKNALDVEVLFVDGGTRTATALIAREVAFGVTAPSGPVAATAAGADLILVAGIVNVPNYDFVVRPEIKSAADLKGKKVAVSGLSGSSYTATRIALREIFKLDPDKDVTYITIGTEPEREAALVAKAIDGSVLNPDLTVKAKKDGLVVLDSLWDKPIAYQHTGLAASKAYLKDNGPVATRFLRAFIQATGYLRDPANKDKVVAILAKYLKIDDKDVLESGYARMSQKLLQCAPYATIDGMKTIIAENKAAVDKGMTAESMVDASFLKAIDDAGFIKANCK